MFFSFCPIPFLFVRYILPAHCQTVNFGATAVKGGQGCGAYWGLSTQPQMQIHETSLTNHMETLFLMARKECVRLERMRMHAILCKPFVPIREKGHCSPLLCCTVVLDEVGHRIYRGGNKGLYVVARNFFPLLLNCSAWPCLVVA